METEGYFSIKHLCFSWMAPWFAQDRLLQRLANRHHLYEKMGKHSVIREIKTQAKESNHSWKDIALQRYDETFIKRYKNHSYNKWIYEIEGQGLPNSKEVKDIIQILPIKPLISILLPVYNTDRNHLVQCINSVLSQSYNNLQLCIADDASDAIYIRPLLEAFIERDKRVNLILRKRNGRIGEAANSALTLAQGEYIALLDHDDILADHALLKVVQAINKNSAAALIYSDEDKIDTNNNRYEPHFKPEWNPDLLLSQNYISHLTVLRTDLVQSVGGFRDGVEGSQDHDLLLRCIQHVNDVQIVHIPEILYHWRAVKGSTAANPQEKSYTTTAGIKALTDYFNQQHQEVHVGAGLLPNTYRVKWPIPTTQPLVSLLIPTRDGYEYLKRCIESIFLKTAYNKYEIIILNNQSRCKSTLDYLCGVAKKKNVFVHDWNQPFNYSAINNYGAKLANGAIFGLLNNDVEVINSGWLEEMVSHACRKGIGCVGAKLYYPNDLIQHGGVILGIGGVAGHSHKYLSRNEHGYFSRLKLVQNLSAVTGACLFVKRSIFEEVDGLDEELAISFNDVDFCLRVREAGYRNLWTPYAELYHYESLTRGSGNTKAKQERERMEADFMRKRWNRILDCDPAYNPNLTLHNEDFSIIIANSKITQGIF